MSGVFTMYASQNHELTLFNRSQYSIKDYRFDRHDINSWKQLENHAIQEAATLQYPLPYPLFQEEQELYSGQKIETFGLKYTTLEEGLKKTYEAFLPVYK